MSLINNSECRLILKSPVLEINLRDKVYTPFILHLDLRYLKFSKGVLV